VKPQRNGSYMAWKIRKLQLLTSVETLLFKLLIEEKD